MSKLKIPLLILIVLLVSIGLVLSLLSIQTNTTGKAVDPIKDQISMRLPIPIIDAHFTQYYIGYDIGAYDQQNLEVILNPGSSDTNPVKMVASGADEFGLAGGPELVLIGRSKGLPLVAIATIHRNSDFPIIITSKESNITHVKDLEGKKLGFFYGHISTDVIRNLLRKEKVNVEEINVGFDYTQLYSGKIIAEHAFRTNLPKIESAGNKEFNIISPKDYGINTHGLTIFTTEEMINKKPEVVERFLKAIIIGTEYTLNNPEKALESILTRNKNLNQETELKVLNILTKPLSNSEKYPIGYMDYEMFKETYDRLVEEGIITKDFDVREAYNISFLEKIHNKKLN